MLQRPLDELTRLECERLRPHGLLRANDVLKEAKAGAGGRRVLARTA